MNIKLNCVIIGQDCEKTIPMCIESVKEADKIIFIDGGSVDDTINLINGKAKILYYRFDKNNPFAISKQRQYCLDYLLKNHKGEYCLVLDADECLDDDGINKIKEYIKSMEMTLDKNPIVDIKMKHLFYNLRYEDATKDVHYVAGRLFKIVDGLFYPDGEHTILNFNEKRLQLQLDTTTIFHLAYCGGLWDIKKRYDEQKKRDSGHDKKFLHDWYRVHLFGKYPIKELSLEEIPKHIYNYFGVDKDEAYFMNRGVELKHSVMVHEWNEYFKPTSILDIGCGRGPYLYFWQWYLKDKAEGLEISDWARDHAFARMIHKGDVCNIDDYGQDGDRFFDLITLIDVLEHVEYDKLDIALENISKCCNKVLISVPVVGDPNLLADKTHIVKESKEWWLEKISKYFEIVETPDNWLFSKQLIIGERKNE